LIANSVERLIASWAQSSSVVSQGVGGGMAAGAAGVGAAGEATQGAARLTKDTQKSFGWWGFHFRAPATTASHHADHHPKPSAALAACCTVRLV
jgi:hypothetical protein